MSTSRRHFLFGLGAVAAASVISVKGAPASGFGAANLSNFLQPSAPAATDIRFGYASITWNEKDEQAIKEISEVGFRGIQLRSNVLKTYGVNSGALRDLLAQHHLELVALSSGGVGIAEGTEAAEVARHLANAKFVHDVGGHYLQVTDSARPKDRKPKASDFKQLGRVMSEIGKRAADLGVPVGYHNHMGSLGETPDEVDRIMEAADPRYVKLELDIAHYQQGGGDPAQAIRKYHDRLLFLHIKDVENLAKTDERGRSYRWVELGRGRVDVPAVFAALREIKYRGWAVVELDSVPDQTRTPKECALINKKYVEEKLGIKIE
jgi:inosose dehydratase